MNMSAMSGVQSGGMSGGMAGYNHRQMDKARGRKQKILRIQRQQNFKMRSRVSETKSIFI